MKLSTGRGIQFFKRPFFSKPKAYAENIYKVGRENIGKAYNSIVNKKK